MADNSSIEFRNEIYRKGIHLASLIIPVTYYLIGREKSLALIFPSTFIFIFVDLLRFYHKPSGKIFYKFFKPILRKHERNHKVKRLSGGSFVMLTAAITMFFFPKYIFITAFSILIISDTSAALIGKLFGLHKLLHKKSYEGTFAFFLTAAFVVLLTPKYQFSTIEYLICIFGAFIGTLVEMLPNPLDDNLTIPISIGLSIWGLYLIFLPTVNLIN